MRKAATASRCAATSSSLVATRSVRTHTRASISGRRALRRSCARPSPPASLYRPRVMYEMSGNKYAVMGPVAAVEGRLRPAGFRHPAISQHDVVHHPVRRPVPAHHRVASSTIATSRPGTHFNRHYARCASDASWARRSTRSCRLIRLAQSVVEAPWRRKTASIRMRSNSRSSRAPKPHAPALGRADGAQPHGMRCYPTSTNAIPKMPLNQYMVYKQYEGIVSDGLPRGFATHVAQG